jgi:ABC-type multidrug transport system ATPase subunit
MKTWPYFFTLLKFFNLSEDILNRTIRQVSYGQGQKLRLMVAFLLKPQVLILPYPTRGLDLESVHKTFQLLADFCAEGHSILTLIE